MDTHHEGDVGGAWRPRPTREQVRVNSILAVVLFLGSVLTMTLTEMMGVFGDPADPALAIPLLAAGTLPLAFRFTYPWQCALVVALAFGLAGGLGVHEYLVLQISMFLALYSEGAWDPDRSRAAWVRVTIIAAMFVWLMVTLFQTSTDPEVLAQLPATSTGWSLSPLVANILLQLVTNVLYFAGAYWFGERSWNAARDRARLEELTVELSAQRRHAEQQAVALERLRIARELHDAVAHHISLIGVQAGAARLTFDSHPDAARRALGEIEDSSRQAVEEMRALLHTLREHDPRTSATDPQPQDSQGPQGEPTASLGVGRLPDLTRESTRAGVPTTLTELGDTCPLPPIVSLNLYRVAQEALTNVRRHAGPETSADVRGRQGGSWGELEVSNTFSARRRATRETRGAGLGLICMRERVQSDGGDFEAHPLSSGGWVVRARIPLPAREGEAPA